MPTTVSQKPAAKKTTSTAAVRKTAVRPKPAPKAAAAVKAKPVAPGVKAKPMTVITPAKPMVAKSRPLAPLASPVAEVKEKVKKAKLVRDSFTMPEIEYAALGEVKKACLKAGFEVKKSELLRIGVAMIRKMDLPALKTAVGALSPLKPGRPRKEK